MDLLDKEQCICEGARGQMAPCVKRHGRRGVGASGGGAACRVHSGSCSPKGSFWPSGLSQPVQDGQPHRRLFTGRCTRESQATGPGGNCGPQVVSAGNGQDATTASSLTPSLTAGDPSAGFVRKPLSLGDLPPSASHEGLQEPVGGI